MAKTRDKMVFVFICIVLGIILSIQFKTVVSTVGEGVNPIEKAKQLKKEYEEIQEQRQELEETLESIEKQIKNYEDIEKDENTNVERLYKELEKYKMFAGYENIKGQGVIIEINEPPMQMEVGEEFSILIENYDILLQLISRLNDLGAEAIAINGQRYTNYTSLKPTVNSIVINGVSISPPFTINVIGNSSEIIKGLKVKGNIMWDMENRYLYDITIKQSNKVVIPKYKKIQRFKYARPINETED